MSDVLRALADRLEAHTEQMANTSWGLTMQEWNVISNDILLAARQLRGALAPVTDEEVERIRERHEELERLGELAHHDWASEAHTDRATLLRRDAQREAELAAVKAERDRAQRACEQMAERITLLEAELGRLREALKDMLAHSCVADAGADMKDEEDHAAERRARAALEPKP